MNPTNSIADTIKALRTELIRKRSEIDTLLVHLDNYTDSTIPKTETASGPEKVRRKNNVKPKPENTQSEKIENPVVRLRPEFTAQSSGAPETFASACKLVIHRAGKPLTTNEVFESVQKNWPDVVGR
jgi:seryl-tRNA synthetase